MQAIRVVGLCGLIIGVWQLAAMGAEPAGGLTADFRWKTGPPVVLPREVDGLTHYSVKDPTIVQFDGRWHLFCTVRGVERSHAIEYLSFAEWSEAEQAERHILTMHEGFFCAPQVFYFQPHRRWYLICQAAREDWRPEYQPAFSTVDDVGDWRQWSKLTPLFHDKPEKIDAWLDFWVICDDAQAHLFFTSLNGKMWRCATRLADFPHGWTEPVVALEGDIFEASHTYRLNETGEYLTLIEAQGGHGWRYYKAYLADTLSGAWRPLAATRDNAFASMANLVQPGQPWTDAISHGELLRSGYDQRLEIDSGHLRFLFQGVLDRDRADKPYGQIPWRLGLLEPATSKD